MVTPKILIIMAGIYAIGVPISLACVNYVWPQLGNGSIGRAYWPSVIAIVVFWPLSIPVGFIVNRGKLVK
jgi:hypothetical protein